MEICIFSICALSYVLVRAVSDLCGISVCAAVCTYKVKVSFCAVVYICMSMCSHIRADLSICVCVLPDYPRYGFNVSLTDWPDPPGLTLFRPFKGDVFRIEKGRPVLKYQRARATAIP